MAPTDETDAALARIHSDWTDASIGEMIDANDVADVRALLAREERVERERDRLWVLVHSVDTEMLREVSCCPSHNEDLHVMAAKFDAARGEARDGQ